MKINSKTPSLANDFPRTRPISKPRPEETVQIPGTKKDQASVQGLVRSNKSESLNNFRMVFSDTALASSLSGEEKKFINAVFQGEENLSSDGYTRSSKNTEKPQLGRNIDVKA
ncbi:MAG: hypothetical protein DWQ05_13980 [Calditrichaeota bacterium]|nr:MAG: hypothetical protein DWQ05_13980 [Calditrichota bacterium]